MKYIKAFENLKSKQCKDIIIDIFEDMDINLSNIYDDIPTPRTIEIEIISTEENMANEFIQKCIRTIWMDKHKFKLIGNGIKDPVLTRIFKLTNYYLSDCDVVTLNRRVDGTLVREIDRRKMPLHCSLFLYFSPLGNSNKIRN